MTPVRGCGVGPDELIAYSDAAIGAKSDLLDLQSSVKDWRTKALILPQEAWCNTVSAAIGRGAYEGGLRDDVSPRLQLCEKIQEAGPALVPGSVSVLRWKTCLVMKASYITSSKPRNDIARMQDLKRVVHFVGTSPQ